MAISPATAAILTRMAKLVAEEPRTKARPRTLDHIALPGQLAYRLLDVLREAGEAGIDIGQACALVHYEETKK